MGKMSFKHFSQYCRSRYINYSCLNSLTATQNIFEYVLSNKDPWFQVVHGNINVLHILGFELQCLKQDYVFYQVNPNITDQISPGDYLVTINGQTPNESFNKCQKSDGCIVLVTKTPQGDKRTTEIRVPKVDHAHRVETLYDSRSENLGYIKIVSFSAINLEKLTAFLSKKTRIIIDLTSCTGGPINDMLRYASHFAYQDMKISFEDNKGTLKRKILPAKNDIDISIRKIDFLVSPRTASSAEMFCLMLRIYYGGAIHGERTMGKLLVQEFIDVEGVIVAVPIYRMIKPDHFYGGHLAYYDDDSIIPDYGQILIP